MLDMAKLHQEWDWPPERSGTAELSFRRPARRKGWYSRFVHGYFRTIIFSLRLFVAIALVVALCAVIWIMVIAISAWS